MPYTMEDADRMNLLDRARQQYPNLPKNIAYRESFGKGADRGGLEYYPRGEEDSFDPRRAAVEVFDKNTRPQDVAADIVSHGMVNSDPVVSQAYRKFLMSMTPWQQRRLQQQYEYAKKNFGETRSFDQWAEMSGQPAWLRGVAFGQWPNPQDIYTPEQIQGLQGVVKYLKNK